ncbi:hypothetical protein R1flu_006848 [Riccia fluitans]|uniref:Uncharacterized protein n=1 Tax=Riccia fluitans TaxID=41844 RepID=A0ABD1YY98_9MARC
MAARLTTTTMDGGAAVGSEVLTTACVTSTTTCPDARSTIHPPSIVVEIGSSVASLAGLPILNGADLSFDFLDRIFQCRDVIEDSSSIVSSSEDSCCPPPYGDVTSTSQDFFLISCSDELDNSLSAA